MTSHTVTVSRELLAIACKRLLGLLRHNACHHAFALEDLKMVNPDGADDRVKWPCDRCGKVFRAHCGLDISPANGPTFQRGRLASQAQGGE